MGTFRLIVVFLAAIAAFGQTLTPGNYTRWGGGTFTANDCLKINAQGRIVSTGAECGSGSGSAVTAANQGSGTFYWFKQKTSNTLEFYSGAVASPIVVSGPTSNVFTLSCPTCVTTGGTYANPSWLSSLAWAKLTGVPSYENALTFSSPFARVSDTISLSLGTANQILGMNSGGTAWENKSFAAGTSGTDFAIAHSANTITFNLPTASGTNRGALASSDWTSFTNHVASTSNPHSVTKTQVSLGNVDNYATASQGEAEAGSAADKFMTPQRTAQAIAALGNAGTITGISAIAEGDAEVVKSGVSGTLGQRGLTAAPGVTITQNTDDVEIGGDSAVYGRRFTDPSSDPGSTACATGDWWVREDTDETWDCTDNTPTWTKRAKATHAHAASDVTSGTFAYDRLGSGTPDGTKFLRDDLVWAVPPGTGGGSSGEYSGTIDFGSVPDASCLQSTFSATGATTSMLVTLSLPAAFDTGLIANGWISAADTATVRVCNFSGAAVNPASATFKVKTVNGYLSGSDTINFSSVPDMSCAASTITVAGAAAGDHVTAGWPTALETGLLGSMFVSAADTVAVRLCNYSGAAVDPASATFKAAVIK